MSLFKTTGGNEYNQDMRQFATTLKFYSSKAYDFVKTVLPNKPRNWLNENIDQVFFELQTFLYAKMYELGDN
jgi:hypothetical protein